mmetsp:Transcript_90466/g.251474  ORF Transcript_90466/g.251474 Transcript_90466/m.251474 type:complete len:383 (+) Transcript_90466:371-1519(+)
MLTVSFMTNGRGSSTSGTTCCKAQTGTTVVCVDPHFATTPAPTGSTRGRASGACTTCNGGASSSVCCAGDGGGEGGGSGKSSSSSAPSASCPLSASFVISGELFAFDGKHTSTGSSTVRKVFFTCTSLLPRLPTDAEAALCGQVGILRKHGSWGTDLMLSVLAAREAGLAAPEVGLAGQEGVACGISFGIEGLPSRPAAHEVASSSSSSGMCRLGCVRAFGGRLNAGSSSIDRKVFFTRMSLTSLLITASRGQLFCFCTGAGGLRGTDWSSSLASSDSLGAAETSSGCVHAFGGNLGDSSSCSTVRKVFFTQTLTPTSSGSSSGSSAGGTPSAAHPTAGEESQYGSASQAAGINVGTLLCSTCSSSYSAQAASLLSSSRQCA